MLQFVLPLLKLLGISLLASTTGAVTGLRFSIGLVRQSSPHCAWLAASATGFGIALLAILAMVVVFVTGSKHVIDFLRNTGPMILLNVTSN